MKNALLSFGRIWKRHNPVRLFATIGKLDEQRAQVVKPEDSQVDQIARLLLRHASVEKVSRHSHVIKRNDLIACVQSLVIRRRSCVNARHHQAIVLLFQVRAKINPLDRSTRGVCLETQPGSFERAVIKLLGPAHKPPEKIFQTPSATSSDAF